MKYQLKKMKETYNKLIILLTVFCVCSALIYFNERYWLKPDIKQIDTVFHCDTFIKKDTFDTTIIKAIPKYVEVIKRDTVINNVGDTMELVTENKLYQDTLVCAKDSIILQSFITGINSKRDSIKANWKRQETIITNTVEITKYIEKKKFINVAPAITAGSDPINRGFGVMIGVGVSFDINQKIFQKH